MELKPLSIPGCYQISPNILQDNRGFFMKTFQAEWFKSHDLVSDFKEEFFTFSQKNVLRGLHFQIPPYEFVKLVACVKGCVLDVLLDLRVGSPMFGKPCTLELNAAEGSMVYMPPGIAHGFFVLSSDALLLYKTSVEFNSDCDKGVSWRSLDIWPINAPILSERDQHHPRLSDYVSPFRYE